MPTTQSIGGFKVYEGNCVVSLTMSDTDWKAIVDGDGNFDVRPFAKAFSVSFRDSFDFLLLVLDSPGTPARFTYSGRYASLGTRVPTRSRRLLGVAIVPYAKAPGVAYNAIVQGPLLHELLHEWANSGVLPNPADPVHWGFSSAGGQLGGWHGASGLTSVSLNTYKASGPPRACFGLNASCAPTPTFGTFANGGNLVAYSPLELFVMGLMPESELSAVTYALNGVWVDQTAGVFTATGFATLSAREIAAALGPRAPNNAQAQTSYRVATLVLTPKTVLDVDTVDVLNANLAGFSFDGAPGYGLLPIHNFASATDFRAVMRAGGIGTETR